MQLEIVGRLLDENERGEREEALVLRFFPSRFSFLPSLSLFFLIFVVPVPLSSRTTSSINTME